MKPRLMDLRNAVLKLHKALLESERISYEASIGPIQSPNHFLQLLTTDPWFAWLRPISELIVAMDESLEEKEPLTVVTVEAYVKQTRQLLAPSEIGQQFPRHYFEALQRDPDVVLAHAEVRKVLDVPKARPGNGSEK